MNYYKVFAETYKHLAEQERQNVEYVQLKVVKQIQHQYRYDTPQADIDKVPGEKENIELDELIHKLEEGSRVLFEGRPGSGKSTLMEKVSCDLANEHMKESHTDANRKFVILVRLRQLNTVRNPGENDLLCTVGCRLNENEKQKLVSNFDRKDGENIIFILDGFDEYAPGQQKENFVHRIINRDIFPKSIVIVSSRPKASPVIREISNMKMVEVVGFNRENVMNYIDEAFKVNVQKRDSLKAHLTKHPKIMNMCYIPVHCFMLVQLYKRQLDPSQLPQTESEFYEHFTLSTYNRFVDGPRNIQKDDTIPYFHQLIEKTDFKKVCKFAYTKTMKLHQVFQEEDFNDLDMVVDERFFVPVGGAVGKSHSFIHLTFQEYLTAIYIAWYCDKSEQKKIVSNHGSAKAFNVVWQFLFGILKPYSKDLFCRIREATKRDHLLHVRCAYESQEEQACTEVFVSHKGNLQFWNILPTDVTYISYVLKNAKNDPNIQYCLHFKACNFSKDDAQEFLDAVGHRQLSLKLE